MSNLLENKQLVHIASECVVLLGVTFYFSKQNKRLMEHIEDLAQRIEEQEDIIKKHDSILKQIVKPNILVPSPLPTVTIKHTSPPLQVPPKKEETKSKVSFIEEYSSEEENLDEELQEELKDLQEDLKEQE